MNQTNITKEIKERIENLEDGSVFVSKDFSDISTSSIIDDILSQMQDIGTIKQVIPNVFYKPIYSEFLGEYISASPNKIAKAIAKNCNWSIVPYADAALNLLGLSTQVPATYIYASDGADIEYSYENITIQFKHTSTKDISNLTYKTALVIQALKTLGKDNIDDIIIKKLSLILSKEEKDIMLKEATNITSWVFDVIKQICNFENKSVD